MLVLTRKVGETIVIADNIRITVVSIGNGRVKIGIDAPHGVSVNREEIHNRILEEQNAPAIVTAPVAEESLSGSGLHNRLPDSFKNATANTNARPELRKPR
ncbi:hypothetical protein BH11PLA2_BH11PLA2_12990 [soil metagenome]